MQIPARFAEYGLTGSFFWLCQLIVLALTGQTESLLLLVSDGGLVPKQDFPAFMQTAVAGLLTVLGITTVFITGLLLDLAAVYFIVFEMAVFKKHTDRHHVWISELFKTYNDYSRDDYDLFRSKFGAPSKERLKEPLKFWRGVHHLKLIAPYDRLRSLLFSHILIFSGTSKLSLLEDQVYQWRTGRAISTAIFIVYLQVTFAGVITTRVYGFVIANGIFLLLVALSFMLTVATYSRVCHLLFALAYMTYRKNLTVPDSEDATSRAT